MSAAGFRHAQRLADRHADHDVERFRMRADATYNQLGLEHAPRRDPRETPTGYRARLIDEALGATAHLPGMAKWRGFTASSLVRAADTASIERIGAQIFADAVAAMHASGRGTGPARTIVMTDESGRHIRRFAGDSDPWSPFRPVEQRLVQLDHLFARAKEGLRRMCGMPEPVGTLMSDGSVRRNV